MNIRSPRLEYTLTKKTILIGYIPSYTGDDVGIAIITIPHSSHLYGWYKPLNMGGLVLLYPHDIVDPSDSSPRLPESPADITQGVVGPRCEFTTTC